MKTLLTDLFRSNRRLVLYCLIGSAGATLDFLTYSAFVKWGGVHPQVANAAGYALGTTLSFTLNALFNFKTCDWLPLRLLSFFGVAFLGWAASAGVLYVTIDVMGWNKYAAKLATMVVAVLLQYNLNRLISFRTSRPANELQRTEPIVR
jgi:putative flippase GtrA